MTTQHSAIPVPPLSGPAQAAVAPAVAAPQTGSGIPGDRIALANRRDDTDFRAAKRHSRFVWVLRRLLPVIALIWGAAFFISATLSLFTLPDISVETAGIEDGKLVMKAPAMSGFDKQNRAFNVTAEKATQDLANTSLVDLEKIDAVLPVDDKAKARITADFGRYDTEAETMVLKDNILIKGARGMDISLKSANIDIKSGAMTSDEAVSVSSDKMNISADSVSVQDNGKRIIFKNRVMTTIQPRQ